MCLVENKEIKFSCVQCPSCVIQGLSQGRDAHVEAVWTGQNDSPPDRPKQRYRRDRKRTYFGVQAH
jgi:hypothetical protein